MGLLSSAPKTGRELARVRQGDVTESVGQVQHRLDMQLWSFKRVGAGAEALVAAQGLLEIRRHRFGSPAPETPVCLPSCWAESFHNRAGENGALRIFDVGARGFTRVGAGVGRWLIGGGVGAGRVAAVGRRPVVDSLVAAAEQRRCDDRGCEGACATMHGRLLSE